MNLLHHSNDTRANDMKRWKTTINVSLSRSQFNSSFSQIFVCLFVVNTSYLEYLQSIKTRRLIKTRKAQIREIWNNIRSRNRYRLVVFAFAWFWDIDRFIIRICKYLRDQNSQQDSHSRDFIFFVFALLFLLSHLSFHICRIRFETFCFIDDQTDIWVTVNESLRDADRSKKVIYSFRNEVWRRRKNNVTSVPEISIDDLFYQRKFLWKLAWFEFDAQFTSNISIYRVHICSLNQIFSLCYLFSRHASYINDDQMCEKICVDQLNVCDAYFKHMFFFTNDY